MKSDFLMDKNLKDCLNVQSRTNRKFALPGRTSREMADELVKLTGGDRSKIQGIMAELLFQYPDKSIDWYFEQAINQLLKAKRKLPK